MCTDLKTAMFLHQRIMFIFSKISEEAISTQSRTMDPLKMEIFVVPIRCYIGGTRLQYARVFTDIFPVLYFCFLKIK